MAPKAPEPVRRMAGLPAQVTGPVDVGRLIRELEAMDNTLLQLSVRAGGSEMKLPRVSHLMEQTAQLNKLNLLQAADRKILEQFLAAIKKESPIVHVSFSADPAPAFIEKLVTWLRQEIHPAVLLTVGLQPTIGAGCIVRTINKQFDFSLRQDFFKKKDLLRKALLLPPAGAAALPAERPAAAEPAQTGVPT